MGGRKNKREANGAGHNADIFLYDRIRTILESARSDVVRTVNTAQVVSNWLIGREIVKSLQEGQPKAGYGKKVIEDLSRRLTGEYGAGYSVPNLFLMRQFFTEYPSLLEQLPILYAPHRESGGEKGRKKENVAGSLPDATETGRITGGTEKTPIAAASYDSTEIFYALRRKLPDDQISPGRLSHDLSWTHYRALLKIKNREARHFYEIEAIKNRWSARQLERQINSLLFERLLKSRDKEGVMELANQGLEPTAPIDAIKDPYVLEFLDLPEAHQLVESKLEEALVTRLADFLLELGTGFAFVARQKRLTLDGDHYYSDLVFYHIKLKCYVVIDLKVGKLTHGDLGQIQMYVNYYDREIRGADDNPTIGLILCTEKNDAMVKYVLDESNKQIFASRYRFTLPTEEELKRELQNEMMQLGLPASKSGKSRKRKST